MSRDLRDWTTFGIGGRARRLTVANDRQSFIAHARDGLILGCGSNVLVSDDGYDGNVVINRYAEFVCDGTVVYVGSGLKLGALCKNLCELSLGGGEWLVGIPGTVGGAVIMNAGAHGLCMSDIVTSVDVLDGERVITLSREQIPFAYRHSGLIGKTIVGATLALYRRERAEIQADMRRLSMLRAQRQPSGKSAGSVFKNPDGIHIAAEIERAGLKGLRRGGAVISEKHANFIVNTGGATARDVKYLIDTVKAELKRFGIDAKEEIIYIGEFG